MCVEQHILACPDHPAPASYQVMRPLRWTYVAVVCTAGESSAMLRVARALMGTTVAKEAREGLRRHYLGVAEAED